MRVAIITRNKPDASGMVPLYVRLTHRGKSYVSLGLKVKPRDWNANRRELRKGAPHARQMNALLAERLTQAESAALAVVGKDRGASIDDIKEAVVEALHPSVAQRAQAAQVDLLAELSRIAERYRERGQVGTAEVYRNALGTIRTYLEGRGLSPLRPGVLTPRLASEMHAALAGSYKVNTLRKKISSFRTLLRALVAEGVEGADEAVAALSHLRLKQERGERPRLTIEQVRALEALDLAERSPVVADVRDMFVFSFYAAGMRRGDILTLRWEAVDLNASVLEWRAAKTGRVHRVPIMPAASTILSRWHERRFQRLPHLPGSQTFVFQQVTEKQVQDPEARATAIKRRGAVLNRNLGRICELAGVPQIRMHAARHSFADHMRRSGASVYDISQVMHKGNLAMTERYLAGFDRETLSAAMRDALS